MTEINRQRLEKYRERYEAMKLGNSIYLKADERNEILEIIRKEFNPGYTVFEWCGECVGNMLRDAFVFCDAQP